VRLQTISGEMGVFNSGGYKSHSLVLLTDCLEPRQLDHVSNWVCGFCARGRQILNKHKGS
jgi:hypothetical protein